VEAGSHIDLGNNLLCTDPAWSSVGEEDKKIQVTGTTSRGIAPNP